MNFEALKRRVERSEHVVEGRAQQTQTHWHDFTTTWRDSWTPTRIVIAGLISGFVVGRSDPAQTLGKLGALGGSGTRVLQLIGTLSGLFASVQASTAAGQAEHAADKAEAVADEAQPTAAPRAPSPPRPAPDPVAPRPAEAATEMSEH
ncbi:hypothetical protein IP90_02383 [Luteimonas cucumeris]|uniref:Protein sip-5 n=1 Tax=Luteimonas cucumeris TaxID=985012 RepID=A0A562L2G2_9GAMM|nr:protein sip-5 [Luteimonas cucumeris]TWI01823.1 hypothetical protein IP90_02383 [Luteimonas cucumeris]